MKQDSQWWYGDCRVGGKRHVIPLGVAIKGERGNMEDMAFVRSRDRAMEAFKAARKELHDPTAEAGRLRRLQEIQTGRTLEKFALADLEQLYRDKPRKKLPSQNTLDQGAKRIEAFCAIMQANYKEVSDLVSVRDWMAEDFIQQLAKRGMTNATLNRYTETLHAAFNAAVRKGVIAKSPFTGIVEFDEQSTQVHRAPFTPDQITAILAKVKSEPVAGPVIITALCTGMRRNNCALLPWAAVDLKAGMIKVKVFKTSADVTIPILPPLREILEGLPQTGEFCFPAAAAMYLKNPDGLNWRFNRVLVKIGILAVGEKKDKKPKAAVATMKHKSSRLRAANRYGFASCKTTFVTVSLDSGIPEMMVRKVVGNEVVDLVLKHYYQPGERELKRQFLEKLPAGLGGVKQESETPQILAEMENLLNSSHSKNWQTTRDELKVMLLKLKQASESMAQ